VRNQLKIIKNQRGEAILSTPSSLRICAKKSFFAAFLLSTSAFAQTAPSLVVPKSAAPEVKATDASVVLPDTIFSRAPEGADKINVQISRVSVKGGDAALADATRQITQPLEGRSNTVTALYEAATQVEALYARQGKILTRATVPPQQLKDGAVFKIVIVDGFIQSVDDSAVPAKVRGPIQKRLARLIGARGLTLAQIERHVLLASRVPGVTLKTTLVPDSAVGGAKLVVQADYRAVQGGLSIHNRLGKAYDNVSFDAQLVGNSLTGHGEQIYALASTTSDFALFDGSPRRRILGVGAFVPVSNNGLSINPDYLHADTNPKPQVGGVPVKGKLDRFALNLSYPAILTRQETLNLQAGFEYLNESQSFTGFGAKLSEDKLRSVNVGVQWGKALSAASTLGAEISVTKGFNWFGARTQADATRTGVFLSRLGSGPDFARLNAAFSLGQNLGSALRASFVVRGQASLSDALPSSAQFLLDGPDGLSGFSQGSISADSGVSARLELGAPLKAGDQGQLAPYVFAAGATGSLSQPTAVELKHPGGWSLGGGVRATLGTHVSLNAELAQSHANIFIKDQTRLTASVSFKF
jgi:hemolysin activation/secretion protein